MTHEPKHTTHKAQVVIVLPQEKSAKSGQQFQVLLLQTNFKRGSFWQNVTGKIEENEYFKDGGLREAREETHLQESHILEFVDLKKDFFFTDQYDRDVHEKAFLLIMKQEWDIILDSREHQAYEWKNIESIHEDTYKFSSNFEALKLSHQYLQKKFGHS